MTHSPPPPRPLRRPSARLLAAALPLSLLPLVALLAGCGKVGPVRAPGPASAIVYPRSYPYYPNQQRQPGQAGTGTGTGGGAGLTGNRSGGTGLLNGGGGPNPYGSPEDPSSFMNRY